MRLGHPASYYTAESFCKRCGVEIFQYVDFDGENIVFRENWYTSTGWYHKTANNSLCGGEEIENDTDFATRYFKISFIPNFEAKREQLHI